MTEQVEAKVKTKQEIINGRMPIAAVYVARFEFADGPASEVANQFGTTVGKIADIRKGSNFGYITADTKFTAEQKQDALDWIKRHPNYDEANADEVFVKIESLPEATQEDIAAFEAARKEARGQRPATGNENAGGGNRRGRKPKAKVEEVEEVENDIISEDEDLID